MSLSIPSLPCLKSPRRWLRAACVGAALGLAAAPAMAGVEGDVDTTTAAEEVAFASTGTLLASEIGDGAWYELEPDETSITLALDDLKRWGITNIYVDVFRNGQTAFPSQIFPQVSNLKGRDWLALLCTEAHQRGIRVHGWMQVLRWQDADSDDPTTPSLLQQHPDWMELDVQGMPRTEPEQALYVTPWAPEARAALTSMTAELCNYPLDGLNLDGVGYDLKRDLGYNNLATREYRVEYEVDPKILSRNPDEDSLWMKWVALREDKITSVVEDLQGVARTQGEGNGRRIAISAVVVPGYEQTRGLHRSYQHWADWLKYDLIDASMPACFNAELPELEQQLWQARSVHMDRHVACIPGLDLGKPGDNMRHPSLKEQRRLLRNAGFQHYTVLDYQALKRAMEQPEPEPEKSHGFWHFLRRD